MGDGWRRRQRRKSSNTRDGGTRTLNISLMSVTELVSQLDKSGLNVIGSETFAKAPPNSSDMSVTPVVHDLASSTSFVGLAVTNASRAARSRLVYKTPFTSRASPTAASGQRTVTPLLAR
jgi:hypothetical protein